MTSPIDLLLWTVLPYLTIVVFVGGTVWRFKYDQFGWTTRSSQLHESRLLRIGGPLFHLGLFMVIGGHVAGLLIPKSLTEWLGIHNELYHLVSLVAGTIAGLATVVGLAVLVYRRWSVPAVRKATSNNDKLTYTVLGATILLGMFVTVVVNGVQGGYDYRVSIAPWFRGILMLQPDSSLIADAPLMYRAHALFGMALFLLWPFSRLVHAFSAPVRYLIRPYVVYRSRGETLATRSAARRGWDQP
ncbi:respiratory nitrate reductase subunit gamma [Actinosynnema sp. ALI-1.44]|uniref:respiratory nitrate reductase subunit gamma n=1 Tax=Actinosynnema sp. ALI-1.44 TaxID=1933779 RepID=UPI00097C502E|nr:respiratory nitrate reductase subunit gamma [Actinosynnema sp. ALI-1.44]ONI75149.1 respiratory nitrate reductase subunit gamma [Actinosynnema sp. ALI-1.44]